MRVSGRRRGPSCSGRSGEDGATGRCVSASDATFDERTARMTEYEFSTDPSRLDRERIGAWMGEQAYWARGRSGETMTRAIEGSRNYGVYRAGDGDQVGYARVITDGATFAWLCDVFVASEERGNGIGKLLVAGILDDLAPLNLKRVMLATRDAHSLYAQYGFVPLPDPALFMVREASGPASSEPSDRPGSIAPDVAG